MGPLGAGGESKIGVVGAGTMGSGIAQLAATYGHQVVLYDTSAPALERAATAIVNSLDGSVEKGRIGAGDSKAIRKRVKLAGGDGDDDSLEAFAKCALVIEAVIEDVETKRDLFARLEAVLPTDAILGTNTSSLSVTAI